MTTKVGKKFLLFWTTKEIWEVARETYSSSENSSELFEIETRLYDLQQGETRFTEYFNTNTLLAAMDMYETYSWKCLDDSTLYKKLLNKK